MIATLINEAVFFVFDNTANVKLAGKATICVNNKANRSPVVFNPKLVPYAVAISMIVYTPSI